MSELRASEVLDLAVYLRRATRRRKIVELARAPTGGLQWRYRQPDSVWAPCETEGTWSEPASNIVVLCPARNLADDNAAVPDLLVQTFHDGALLIASGHDEAENPTPAAGQPSLRLPVLVAGQLQEIYPQERRSVYTTVHERRMTEALRSAGQSPRPLALISTYNEADVILPVISHHIREGIDVKVIDNWSSDDTWSIVCEAARADRRVTVERFPRSGRARHGNWEGILQRKQEIAAQHKGRWILHADADEIRRSPFEGVTLAACMHAAGQLGYNRLDFTVLNFCPVSDAPFPGDFGALRHFQFASHASHFDQKKCWLQGHTPVDLVSTGGHCAGFGGARDFPYKGHLLHFPIRSPAHGQRKVFDERLRRWSKADFAKGWHGHYAEFSADASFIWPAEDLLEFDETWRRQSALVLTSDLVRQRMMRGEIRKVEPICAVSRDRDEVVRLLQVARARMTALEYDLEQTRIQARDLNTALVAARKRAR